MDGEHVEVGYPAQALRREPGRPPQRVGPDEGRALVAFNRKVLGVVEGKHHLGAGAQLKDWRRSREQARSDEQQLYERDGGARRGVVELLQRDPEPPLEVFAVAAVARA